MADEKEPPGEGRSSDAVPYDRDHVARMRATNDEESRAAASPEAVFGAEFLQRWANKIEEDRPNDFGSPGDAAALSRALEVSAFFAGGLSTMALPEPDGVSQISNDQKKRALGLARKIFKAAKAYREYRDSFGVDPEPDPFLHEEPQLPHCDRLLGQADALVREIEQLVARPRSRGEASCVLSELRGVLVEFTGRAGRSTDRVTGVESGLLFDFAMDMMMKLAPDTPAEKLASRIRTALRQLG